MNTKLRNEIVKVRKSKKTALVIVITLFVISHIPPSFLRKQLSMNKNKFFNVSKG
jgi:hypothetical protein